MSLTLETDVLIIGGGLAGCWAAIAAAEAGAEVVLADKGYCGTSGVTATAGPNHWWVPPDPDRRAQAVRERNARALGLADPRWMARIIDTTWRTLPTLADYYDHSITAGGVPHYQSLRGPEYLRALRRYAEVRGVRILDHSPALELLLHADGAVAGARGLQRQEAPPAGRDWTVRAAGVVVATGGCAFLAKLLGSRNNTGDGHLMAAEAGARLSGMEFSTYHTVAERHSTQTRSASYAFADYFDAAGRPIDTGTDPDVTLPLARALLAGPVYATLARMPADLRAILHQIQPAILLPFQRQGIDPFTQRFPITLHGEGTVRGTGGLRLADEDCQTDVPGLYAAGDAATRELIAGAVSGGGAQNSAWAVSSGTWAGQAAARLAHGRGRRTGEAVDAAGGAGLRPTQGKGTGMPQAAQLTRQLYDGVRSEMLPYDKILFRRAPVLRRSSDTLADLWRAARDHLAPGRDATARVRAREAAALVACARWVTASALARTESRGLHRREDAAALDPAQTHRLVSGGLDAVWVAPEGAAVSTQVA
ncbi:FAD-dependent oxidoreductase [Nitrospirillum pindoramense]|uniref:Succinate dehydrogenase/fumarate reductase flavoprotein subunit n=1 Tax=Nitrospirillum amazonense TaxID=28077 RepID=A0A560GKU7_9PROT|nr:FAD-binding protein [Nitrospirillum amazonense]TWB34618.1 succinate dehydrogenase/fumarate reductase flavoprotein subunit [Nitrospirillum amazonense]